MIVVAVALGAGLAGGFFLGRGSVDTDAARTEGFKEGRERGVAVSDDFFEVVQSENAVESARYAAIALDLWKTFDSIGFEMESPDAFFDNANAAEAVESDLEDARGLIESMEAIQLRGRRFELQRDAYVRGARGCLPTAEAAAEALANDDAPTSVALATPFTKCIVKWRDLGARIAYR